MKNTFLCVKIEILNRKLIKDNVNMIVIELI